MWDIEDTTVIDNEIGSLQEQWISHALRNKIMAVNGIILFSLAGMGLCSNILSMCIFAKFGLNININVSYLALSVFDLAISIVFILHSLMVQNIFGDLRLPFISDKLGILFISLISCSTFVTAFILMEMCCCVLAPSKVKKFFKIKLTVGLILVMLLVQVALASVHIIIMDKTEFSTNGTSSDMSPLAMLKDAGNFDLHFALILGGATVPTLFFYAVVFLSTIIIGITLKRRNIWLASMNHSHNAILAQNRKLVAMVVATAAVFIICNTPRLIFTSLVDPLDATKENLFVVSGSFVRIFQVIPSAFSIFVYYKTSSRYNLFLKNLLCFPCAQIHSRCYTR